MTTTLLLLPAVLAALLGYGLGSIPFGLLFTRAAGLGDIRAIGSGNIGATNVLRTGRKGLAAATLLADGLKGAAAALAARALWGADYALIAGLFAFLGHVFPLWLGFRGGKGVATFIGVLVAWRWEAALVFGLVWLASALISRYSSLSALVASAVSPAVLWLFGLPEMAVVALLMVILLYYKHKENILRLIAGTEGRIGEKARPAAETP